MHNILKTEAVVVRARNYGEADQLLTIFTEKAGKVVAIVKGVRKTKSKLRGGVQVFSHTNLVLYMGKNLATVTQAEVIHSFSSLREDLLRMSYASYLGELIDAVTPLGERDQELFALFLKALYLLSVEEPWLSARAIEAKILKTVGYQPELEHCVNCGKKLSVSSFFSIETGGILCSQCSQKEEVNDIMAISGETHVVLRQLMQMELIKINRLKLSSKAKEELEKILDLYITYNLGKKMKAKEVIKSLF